MDQETLEKLIADQPREIRAKAILLFNGTATCAAAYQKEPTAANRRNWEDSAAALAKFTEQLGVQEDSERPFPTIADVLEYLQADGWRITKTSLYRHQKQGKFLPQRDGSYARRDIDKYAKTWLKEQSTGKRVSAKMDELQQRKLQAEVDALELQKKRSQFALDRDTKNFIRREQMDLELASRAGILDAGLKHWVKSHAAEWIRLVEGNMQRIGELISKMNSELDEHVNSYAASTEFEVVIDAAGEAGSEEMEEEFN